MAEPHKFSQRKDEIYPVEWFKEPYSLLAAMLCRLYGLPNCSYFKEEWASISHHVITTGKSLPWASILSLELKTTIEEFQKDTARKKSNFFFYAYIVDIFCAEFHYPNMGWSWVLWAPPVHISHSNLWDTNYVTRFYDICESFLSQVYFLIFSKEALGFSPEPKTLIATMGD